MAKMVTLFQKLKVHIVFTKKAIFLKTLKTASIMLGNHLLESPQVLLLDFVQFDSLSLKEFVTE